MNAIERIGKGLEHDKRSMEMFAIIRHADWKYGNDSLGLRSGIVGDNGDILMYALDCYFEKQDHP